MNNDVPQPRTSGPADPVLVGVDGSPQALRAVDRAVDEARARGTSVLLLGVHPTVGIGDPGLERRFREEIRGETQRVLAEALRRVNDAGLDGSVAVAEGDAAQAIIEAARDACLVVTGKRGRGGALRGRIGSVSNAVAAHSPVPVVVIPDEGEHVEHGQGATEHEVHVTSPEAQGGTRTPAKDLDFSGSVVVGVDALGLENPAVSQAVGYATAHGLALSLVSVNGALSGTPEWFQDQYNMRYYFKESVEILERMAAELGQQYPDLPVTQHLFLGKPGRVLVEASRTAALVVVGSRGIGGFTGLIMGSVSQAVLASAAGPVMVVPSGH